MEMLLVYICISCGILDVLDKHPISQMPFYEDSKSIYG